MSKKEREALLIFMRMAMYALHPNFTLKKYSEILRAYEEHTEESDNFMKFPFSERQAFFMLRSMEVFEGKIDQV